MMEDKDKGINLDAVMGRIRKIQAMRDDRSVKISKTMAAMEEKQAMNRMDRTHIGKVPVNVIPVLADCGSGSDEKIIVHHNPRETFGWKANPDYASYGAYGVPEPAKMSDFSISNISLVSDPETKVVDVKNHETAFDYAMKMLDR